MSGGHSVASTSLRATALILVAAAAVVGVLELVDTFLTSASVQISSEPWSALSALTGLLRVAGLAAIGAFATWMVLTAHQRYGRGPSAVP